VRDPELFVVEVSESMAVALTGREGCIYVSPLQEREQALELVALLLGHPTHAKGEPNHVWRHAIAGGQRSVSLRRVT
jgi:hypothetical protein